jgi:hypothetical protein
MQLQQERSTVCNNFDLKNVPINLIASPKSTAAQLPIGELEAFRVSRQSLSASKHGLEVLCGGSCETGAQ